MKTFLVLCFFFLFVGDSFGQTTKIRKYRTYSEVPIRSKPEMDAPQIGTIPKNTTVETTEKEKHWIKVKVKSVEGWAASTLMERVVVGKPSPELDFSYNGSKELGATFRYFFGISNDGTASFSGTLTVRLYRGDELAYSESASCSENPIEAPGGRSFFIDLTKKVDRYEFEANGETVKGNLNHTQSSDR